MNYITSGTLPVETSVSPLFRHKAAEFVVLESMADLDRLARSSESHRLLAYLDSNVLFHKVSIDGLETLFRMPTVGDLIFVPAHYDIHVECRGRAVTLACLEFPKSTVIRENPNIVPRAFFRDTYVFEALRAMAARLYCGGRLDIPFLQAQTEALQAHLAVKLSEGMGDDLHGAVRTRLTDLQLAAIMQQLEDDLYRKLNVQDLAQECGMSVRTFCQSFQASVGKTPTQYLLLARVTRARELLRQTNMDITSIALSVGFSSHAHLTRTFRRLLGTTPRDIRRHSSA